MNTFTVSPAWEPARRRGSFFLNLMAVTYYVETRKKSYKFVCLIMFPHADQRECKLCLHSGYWRGNDAPSAPLKAAKSPLIGI